MTRKTRHSVVSFDVVVIGGGHNGLVCAGYLAKRGFSVAILEQKHTVGGCVVTEELRPGWRVNTYGMEHYVIQNTPIISDLSLTDYGLRYHDVEPTVFSPFRDGRSMLFHRALEKTLSNISKFSQKDARAYEKFHQKWSRVQRAIGGAALKGPMSLERTLAQSRDFSERTAREDMLEEMKLSAAEILSDTFESEHLSSPIAFLGPAAVGQSPAARGTGMLLGWHIGAERLARPAGGSGALTQSLAEMVEAHGGTIMTNERVVKIIVREGKVRGVETASGKTIEAGIVVSNADPKQTLLSMLDDGRHLSAAERRKVRAIRVSGGFAFKVDYLLSGLPRYSSSGSKRSAGAATFIAPSVDSLTKAHEEFSSGRNPKEPGLMVALHSVLDPSLAPPGKHGLMLETRYTPYEPGGRPWTAEAAHTEADRLLALFEEYAPGTSKLVERARPISPLDMERDVMVPRGNFMHIDMTIDQMVDARPAKGLLDGYRVGSIEGLYLCGAGTFPGGAISGVPGRNAAMQIISENVG